MTEQRLLIGLAVQVAEPPEIVAHAGFAERHGLNFALFDDPPGAPGQVDASRNAARGGLDPIEAAAFASAITRTIGLVATAPVTHAEPYHLSNRFSSLDWGSSGRAGWLATIDTSPARTRAYCATTPDLATATREAEAVVEAARRLWDSWEDDALIADLARGRFLDHEKLHYVDVNGEFFSIRGPALMPRPIQGQVVVLGRDGETGVHPEVVLVQGADLSELVQATERARSAGTPKVFAEIRITLGLDLLGLLHSLAGQLDGVVLHPGDAGHGLDELAQHVAPALIAAGTLIPPRPGQSLRDQLGLPRPVSRYAVTKGQS